MKRIKIVAIITSLCLCLSLFAVGVLSASQVNFSVISTLNFISEGVYVKAEGDIKFGNSYASAQVNGNYNYVGYSYEPIDKGTNDLPDGSFPVGFIGDEASWNIGDLYFTSENTVIVYSFSFTNYSNFDVKVTINNTLSFIPCIASEQVTVDTYVDGVVRKNTYSLILSPYEEDSTIKTFDLVLTLNNFYNLIELENLYLALIFGENESVSAPITAEDWNFDIMINEVQYADNLTYTEINELKLTVKEGDSLYIMARNNGTSGTSNIYLYNSLGVCVNSWLGTDIRDLHITVPELLEGYYFLLSGTYGDGVPPPVIN